MTPLALTLAIPNYNGGEPLRRALLSCRRTDLPVEQYEILLIDNNSTDASLAIAHELSATLPNLRVEVNDVNVGRVQNWNVALQAARGQFIVFLFSNDEIAEAPQFAEKVAFMQHEEVDVLMCPKLRVLEDGSEQTYDLAASTQPLPSQKFVESQLNEAMLPFAPMQGNVYHLNLIRARNLYFDPNMPVAADQLFSFQLALHARQVGWWPQPHLRWYASSGRFHSTISIGQLVQADLQTLQRLELQLSRPLNWPRIQARLLVRVLINMLRPQGSFKRTDEKEAISMIIKQAGTRVPLVMAWLIGETAFRALRLTLNAHIAKFAERTAR